MNPKRHRFSTKLRLRHLELIDALGTTFNIHQAAPLLNLTQPAVSKMLQEVEELYGTRLFERAPRGLRPTPPGEVVIKWARQCLTDLDRAIDDARVAHEGSTGRVRIGALPVVIPSLLLQAVQHLRSHHPGIQIVVLEGDNQTLLPRLAADEIDLIVGRPNTQWRLPIYHFEPLKEEPVCFIVRKGHPLLQQDLPTLSDVLRYEWVLQPEASSLRAQLESYFMTNHLSFTPPRLETSSVLLMLQTVAASDLVGIMPQGVARISRQPHQIDILRIKVPVDMPRVGVLRRHDAGASPSVEKFVDILRGLAQHTD